MKLFTSLTLATSLLAIKTQAKTPSIRQSTDDPTNVASIVLQNLPNNDKRSKNSDAFIVGGNAAAANEFPSFVLGGKSYFSSLLERRNNPRHDDLN